MAGPIDGVVDEPPESVAYGPRAESPATMEPSKGTPIAAIEAARKSASVFESGTSRQPRSRASASAAGTSGNTGQLGSESPSAVPSHPASSRPSLAASRTSDWRSTSRYGSEPSSSTRGSISW